MHFSYYLLVDYSIMLINLSMNMYLKEEQILCLQHLFILLQTIFIQEKILNLLKLTKMDRSFLKEKKNELNIGIYFNHYIV